MSAARNAMRAATTVDRLQEIRTKLRDPGRGYTEAQIALLEAECDERIASMGVGG